MAVAALVVQLGQFTPAGGQLVGNLGPALYVLTTAIVLLVVVGNRRLAGLPIVAVGAASNLAAIAANGGYMPADPAALALAGLEPPDGPSNSVVLADPVLRPLTDIFALPEWAPFANVFSVGDMIIGVGVVVTIAAGMRSDPREGNPTAGVRPLA